MPTNRNAFRLLAGAGLVLAAVVVGVPLGAQAVAPAVSPTASPFRTATSFPTPNPSVYPTLVGTAWAEMTRTAGTPQPPPMGPTQMAELGATQSARLQTVVASTPRTTPSPSGSPAATPTPDPCRSPLPAGAASTTFMSKDGNLSFDYPANWKVVAEYPQGSIRARGVLIVNVSEACTSSFSHGLEARDFVTLKVEVVPLTLGKARNRRRLPLDLPNSPDRERALECRQRGAKGSSARRARSQNPSCALGRVCWYLIRPTNSDRCQLPLARHGEGGKHDA